LQELAKREKITLNVLIQGAWAVLLHRYLERDDVVFGTTVASRPHEWRDADTMVGPFIATLPKRAKLDGQRRFMDWIKPMLAEQVQREEHGHLQLVNIRAVSELPVDRNMFDILLQVQSFPVTMIPEQQDWGVGLEIRAVHTRSKDNYPFTLKIGTSVPMQINATYDSQRFYKATATGILRGFERLLENIAQHPYDSIAELSTVLEPELGQQKEGDARLEKLGLSKLKSSRRRSRKEFEHG
jgi:non-ribosomal peptide synthetase component F